MRIVYKFPTRSRPEKFFKALDNIFSFSKTDDWKIVVTADLDDNTMHNPQVIERVLTYGNKVEISFGLSKNKVDAINKGLNRIGKFDILVCMSDDIVFTKQGFDEQIISDTLMYAPDTDIFLHYFDGRQKNTSILNIVGKKYFDRTGLIYHPTYTNVFCDNEETERAKLLGKYKFIDKVIFEHHHPIFQKVAWDAQYRKNEHPDNYSIDRATYNKRKLINFGI